jgi:threonine/homoserine/homoserine lactone efflux protein
MEGHIEFCLAVVALLAVPGPTNTLLAASGSMVGFRRSLRLVLGELSGYVVSILTLRATVGVLVGQSGNAQIVLRVLVATYLAYLSIRLWRETPSARGMLVSTRRVFITTLVNPKAFVFALLLIPPQPTSPAFYYGAFALLVAGIGPLWILAGHLARRVAGDGSVPHVARVASLALVAFAAIVVFGIFR